MGYNKGEMIALGFILMFVPAIFVGLRVWARRLCGAQMGSDDYTIFAALVGFEHHSLGRKPGY